VKKKEDIAAMVRAVAPKPLNVLMFGPGLCVAELADLGVRRISVGGALARVALGAMMAAAEEIRRGSFFGLAKAGPGKRFNDIFASFADEA
jgi:2-methylisocitrate lyase-like PEP mutase family enzyme